MRRTRQNPGQTTTLLAGWLFADLALGLVIVLLATATDFPQSTAAPTPSPSPSPSPSPEPEPELRQGMETTPVEFEVRSNPDGLLSRDSDAIAEMADGIRAELGPYEEDGRRAGFVLTWGVSGEPGDGSALARAANDVLFDAVPDLMGPAAVRDLWRSQNSAGVPRGTIRFEVFLYVG